MTLTKLLFNIYLSGEYFYEYTVYQQSTIGKHLMRNIILNLGEFGPWKIGSRPNFAIEIAA